MAPATPVDAPVAPAVSPTEEQVAGAMIGDVPIEEVDAVVNAPANEGNAPAAADASAGISAVPLRVMHLRTRRLLVALWVTPLR